jgi:hypothetical protein
VEANALKMSLRAGKIVPHRLVLFQETHRARDNKACASPL